MKTIYKIIFILSLLLFAFMAIIFGGVLEYSMKTAVLFSLIPLLYTIIRFRKYRSILFLNFILIISLFYQTALFPPRVIQTVSPETHALYSNIIPLYDDPAESSIINIIAEEENFKAHRLLIQHIYRDRGYSTLEIPEDTQNQSFSFIRENSYKKTALIASLYIYALFFSLISSFGRNYRRKLEKILIIFISLMSLLQIAIGYRNMISHAPSHLGYRLYVSLEAFAGTYVNKNHIASLLLMLTLILTGHLASSLYKFYDKTHFISIKRLIIDFYHSRQWYYILLFPIILGLTASVFSTLSRMGVFSFIISMFLFIIFFIIMFSRHKRLYSIISLILVILILSYSFKFFVQDEDLFDIMERYQRTTATEVRFFLYDKAIELIKIFPITGVGMGNTQLMLSAITIGTSRRAEGRFGFYFKYLHSDLLQFILEGGIIALLILLLFIYDIIRKLLGSINRMNIKNIGYFCAIIGVLIHASMDFSLHIPANLLLLCIIYGLFSAD